MAALLLLCLPFALAAPAVITTSAFPTVTPIQVGKGTCDYFPSSSSNPYFSFHAVQAENSTANGLFTSITPGGGAAGLGARVVLSLLPDEAKVLYACNKGVVSNYVNFQSPGSVYFDADTGYRALTYLNGGKAVETYQHDGMEGIFVGHGNQTTWAFQYLPSFIPHPSPYARDYFGMRLLPAGGALQPGEFKGFVSMTAGVA